MTSKEFLYAALRNYLGKSLDMEDYLCKIQCRMKRLQGSDIALQDFNGIWKWVAHGTQALPIKMEKKKSHKLFQRQLFSVPSVWLFIPKVKKKSEHKRSTGCICNVNTLQILGIFVTYFIDRCILSIFATCKSEQRP